MPKKHIFFFIGLVGIFISPLLFDPLAGLIQRFGPSWAAAKISRINHLSFWMLSFVWAVYFGIWVWKSDWNWFSSGNLKRKFYLVLAGAALVRVALIIVSNVPLGSDAKDYDRLAQNLAQTGRYEENGQPTAFRPVGYPAFLAGIYTFFGHQILLPKLANVLFDMLSLLLLWKLFGIWRDDKTALQATAIAAFYPPTIYTSQLLLSEHFFGFLWILSIYLCEFGKSRGLQPLFSGFFFGLAALTRPVVLVWGFLPAFSALFKKRWLPLAGFVLGAILVTGPWFYRNYSRFGVWTLSTNAGINFWMRSDPHATGRYHFPDSMRTDFADEGKMEAESRQSGWKFMLRQPLEYFWRGLAEETKIFGFDYTYVLTSLAVQPPYGELLWGILGQTAWWILLFFAAAKTARLLANRQKRSETGALFCLTTILCWAAAHFFFMGVDRFHHPLVPFFAYLAVLPLSPKPETDRLHIAEGNRMPIQN